MLAGLRESPLQNLRRWSPRNRAGQGVATRDAAVRRQAQIGATAWVTATKMRARAGPNKGKIQTERACRGEANKISQQAPGIVAHDKKRPPTINSVRKQHHPYGNGNGHTPWSILLPPWLSVEESTCVCLGASRGHMVLVTGWLLQLLGRLWELWCLRRWGQ